MKHAIKTGAFTLLGLAAATLMHTAAADTTSMAARCSDSFSADFVAIHGCSPAQSLAVSLPKTIDTPQGYGQAGAMQTLPETRGLHADRIQSGYHSVKITPFDEL